MNIQCVFRFLSGFWACLCVFGCVPLLLKVDVSQIKGCICRKTRSPRPIMD